MSFGDRLRELRLSKNMSMEELGDFFNISKQAVSSYEKTLSYPKIDNLHKIADFFNVSTDYLLGRLPIGSDNEVSQSKKILIPLVGKVSAGVPIEAIENPDDWLALDMELYKIPANGAADYFCLEVSGLSMEPTIFEGEIVLVKKQPTLENRQVGVFLCNGCEATIKRYSYDNGNIFLVPDNKQYQALMYNKDFTILGRVLKSISREIS